MLRDKLLKWLRRPSPDRSLNAPGDVPMIIFSDIGQTRDENQDRVAAMRVHPGGNTKPFIAVALADGMGGMRDGALCAAMTISSFFFGLVKFRALSPESRLERALALANDDVFAFSQSQGGATLSAILFTPDTDPFTVNIGDSRIYVTHGIEKEIGVRRVTVDDSIEEALGGHGRELLQFIGMGRGIRPHINQLQPDTKRILITSDGVHFINQETISGLIINSPDNKQLAERLGALVRWSGAPDNASMLLTSSASIRESYWSNEDAGVQVWDHFGSLDIVWLKEELNGSLPDAQEARPPVEPIQEPAQQNKAAEKPARTTKKKSRPKKEKQSDAEPQLKIEIIEGGGNQ